MKKTNRVYPASYVKASKYTPNKIDKMYEMTEEYQTRSNLRIRNDIEDLLEPYDEDGDKPVGTIYPTMSAEDQKALIALLEKVEKP